jgi:hypothetical protein
LPESYKEVIHEDKIKIGGSTKAPDYSFRIPGQNKLFFLEAKKPSIKIKDEIDPSYQIKRYGWNAQMKISVLTDFEEFAIYDCSKKPFPSDKSQKARLRYLTFDQYEKEWDFLWGTFSKEAAETGGFKNFLKTVPNKKGTDTVDKDFLKSLDEWRTLLAETINEQNKILNEDELNFVVQQTLDRIIFIRIAEDRNIEPYAKLKSAISKGCYYDNLLKIFNEADEIYNSGLFNFKKDLISPRIKIDNNTLKEIINQLYYPECPFEFSVLSVEILGSAYEQFLGKTISINENGKAIIELKPEVRKAGGVFYTPEYVVDYIVNNTLGNICKNKTPKEVALLKIVDPACGSGSFLIGAYKYLLKWHHDYYINHPTKKNPLTPEGILTTSEKKKILLNNIYGVDIDSNAVEVTKLSLLLKCLEGETQSSLSFQFTMFNERALPTLDENIKSGNSLIDIDFYDTEFDFGEEKKIKPYSWEKAFPSIFKNGGFDVVVGNPPFITFSLGKGQEKQDVKVLNYLINKYKNSSDYKINSFALFYERALMLLREKGKCAFIVPGTIMINETLQKIRKHFIEKYTIENITSLKYKVFSDAEMGDTAIVFLSNEKHKQYQIPTYEYLSDSWLDNGRHFKINSNSILNFPQNRFYVSPVSYQILSKGYQENVVPCDEPIVYFYNGIKTGDNKKFLSEKPTTKKHRLVIRGRDFTRYNEPTPTIYVYFEPKELWSNSDENKLTVKNKIIIRQTADQIVATLETEGIVCMDTVHMIYKTSLNKYFLLGILNSKFINKYHNALVPELGKAFAEIKIANLKQLPMPKINLKNISEKNRHDEIVTKVEQLLVLTKSLNSITLETKKEILKQKIEYLEDKINYLVYQIYNISEEEIKLIENN